MDYISHFERVLFFRFAILSSRFFGGGYCSCTSTRASRVQKVRISRLCNCHAVCGPLIPRVGTEKAILSPSSLLVDAADCCALLASVHCSLRFAPHLCRSLAPRSLLCVSSPPRTVGQLYAQHGNRSNSRRKQGTLPRRQGAGLARLLPQHCRLVQAAHRARECVHPNLSTCGTDTLKLTKDSSRWHRELCSLHVGGELGRSAHHYAADDAAG